jgi:hypothetical protein
MGEAGQAGVTRQPDWMFHTPEHIAGLVRRTIGSRRFLVYGSLLLHVLHLLYRWSPGRMRALPRPAAAATRAASAERRPESGPDARSAAVISARRGTGRMATCDWQPDYHEWSSPARSCTASPSQRCNGLSERDFVIARER